MCNDCWKEFKGWCKSFTRTEVLLGILEAILLILFLLFLIFLIMHLIVCASWVTKSDPTCPATTTIPDKVFSSVAPNDSQLVNDNQPTNTKEPVTNPSTLGPEIKCTWEPSKKTEAAVHYYEDQTTSSPLIVKLALTKKITVKDGTVVLNADSTLDKYAFDEQSDGEEPGEQYKSSVLAVVKLHPPSDVTFGCIVAVISEHWTLTAASCVDAVEEIDSLDNFVLMERYGEARRGRTHTIADVQIHPLYQGANHSYDVAALRSETSLRPATAFALPSIIDYCLVTVGERFSILGFGNFRTIDPSNAQRPVRSVDVYTVPSPLCRVESEERWSVRHLSRGRAEHHGAPGCGAGALCAAVRYGRGLACTFCGGTPLVRRGVVMGVMGNSRGCAVACEPSLYVSVALVRDWLDMLLSPDH
ncbi:hypothetical protein O0L34_g12844 [Tuta absoluta]|nr:hypothetical protein O0L34_g12844 [Tuta absoluta]